VVAGIGGDADGIAAGGLVGFNGGDDFLEDEAGEFIGEGVELEAAVVALGGGGVGGFDLAGRYADADDDGDGVLGDEVVEDDGRIVAEGVEADVEAGRFFRVVGGGDVDGDGAGGVREDFGVVEGELEGLADGDAGLGFGVCGGGIVVGEGRELGFVNGALGLRRRGGCLGRAGSSRMMEARRFVMGVLSPGCRPVAAVRFHLCLGDVRPGELAGCSELPV